MYTYAYVYICINCTPNQNYIEFSHVNPTYTICEHYFIVITTDSEFQCVLYYISPLIFVDAFRYYLFKNSLLVDNFKSTVTIVGSFCLVRKITSVEISNAQSFISGVFYISH